MSEIKGSSNLDTSLERKHVSDEENQKTKGTTKKSGAVMNSLHKTDQKAIDSMTEKVVRGRFGPEADRPMNAEELKKYVSEMRFQEIVSSTDDPTVSALGESDAAKATPLQLYAAWGDHLKSVETSQKSGEVAAHIKEVSEERGKPILQKLKGSKLRTFGNKKSADVDAIDTVAGFYPELQLALAMSPHSQLGGTELLARVIEGLDVPQDVLRPDGG